MIGLKIFLTGLIVFVVLGIIKKTIDPAFGTPAYVITGLLGFFTLIAMVVGLMVSVWSL